METEEGTTYRTDSEIDSSAVLTLFRENEWREWFTTQDTKDLLTCALYVATAWEQEKLVGICTLFGDGRFYARVDTLLVDEKYRRRGIGSRLVEMIVSKVNELKPHYCELDTHEDWMVGMYEKFGFEVSEGPWLTHGPTEKRLGEYVTRRRVELQGR